MCKHCEDSTKNLAKKLNYRVCDIKQLCINEGAKSCDIIDKSCINLDEFEKKIAKQEKREQNKTMDFCMATIKNKNSKYKILLCDLKLNHKNPRKINTREIKEKIKYSKFLIGKEEIYTNYSILIFNASLVEQAMSYINRLIPTNIKNPTIKSIN